jgi:hypothetical protein
MGSEINVSEAEARGVFEKMQTPETRQAKAKMRALADRSERPEPGLNEALK